VEKYIVTILKGYKNIKVHRSIPFPAVLCGCVSWSVTLKKEYNLRLFEKRVLRNVFGPKLDEVIREWRKLHNEKLNDLTSHQILFRSSNQKE